MENLRSTAQARNTKTYNDNYKKTVTFENEKCTCRVSTDAQMPQLTKKGEKEPRVTQIAKQEIETSLDKSREAFADMLNADGLVLTR